MEAFSLLKYWRSSGGVSGGGATVFTESTQTIVTAAVSPCSSSDGEDGRYFDLEFALPEDQSDTEVEDSESQRTGENGDEAAAGDGNDDLEGTDRNELTLSPGADELLFQGNVVAVEPPGMNLNDSEDNSKFPVSLAKSATKFRVLLLKLKKSKPGNGFPDEVDISEKTEANGQEIAAINREIEEKPGKVSGMLFTVKCKVEEVRMPLVSLFTRDKDTSAKVKNERYVKDNPEDPDSTAAAVAANERKLSKEVVQKYLKMVKPLYIRVSKRYVDKLKFPGQLNFSGGASKGGGGAVSPPEEKRGAIVKVVAAGNVKSQQKQMVNTNLQAGLKVVRKHLGKSRSASAAAVASPPQSKAASSRRDDSLLQLHDGIQGAILHCKKSFNASRDGESSILSRSVSDPSYEKSVTISPDSSSSSSSSPGEAPAT